MAFTFNADKSFGQDCAYNLHKTFRKFEEHLRRCSLPWLIDAIARTHSHRHTLRTRTHTVTSKDKGVDSFATSQLDLANRLVQRMPASLPAAALLLMFYNVYQILITLSIRRRTSWGVLALCARRESQRDASSPAAKFVND